MDAHVTVNKSHWRASFFQLKTCNELFKKYKNEPLGNQL